MDGLYSPSPPTQTRGIIFPLTNQKKKNIYSRSCLGYSAINTSPLFYTMMSLKLERGVDFSIEFVSTSIHQDKAVFMGSFGQ